MIFDTRSSLCSNHEHVHRQHHTTNSISNPHAWRLDYAMKDHNISRFWCSEHDPGDRYSSLPSTSRNTRRLQGENITTQILPLRSQTGATLAIDPDLVALQARHNAWIESEPQWKSRLGDSWRGTKILGAGNFGIAGLWTRGRHTPTLDSSISIQNIDKDVVNHVVVKQSKASPATVKAMHGEAEIMKLFSRVKTNHVVKIYRDYIVDPVDEQVDPTVSGRGNNVARIFMEYCPGGDMAQFLEVLTPQMTCTISLPRYAVYDAILLAEPPELYRSSDDLDY